MARGDAAWLRQVAEFRRELQTALSPAFIGKHMAEHKAKPIINAVIGSATAGIGPGDSRYKDYSDSYKRQLGLRDRHGRAAGSSFSRTGARKYLATGKGGKRRLQLAKAAGKKRWLRGIDHPGRVGGMLDPKRFKLAVEGGKLWLIWTSEGGDMDVYADLHNTGGPKLPQRQWMHFETALTQRTVHKALEQTLDEIAAKFNLGAPIR